MSDVVVQTGCSTEIEDGLLDQIGNAVNHLLSLKTTQLASELMRQNNCTSDCNPVFMWTLPNGTIVGDPSPVGNYFFDEVLVAKWSKKELLLNPFDVIKSVMQEIDKLQCEFIGVA